jgi:hypothetical protein
MLITAAANGEVICKAGLFKVLNILLFVRYGTFIIIYCSFYKVPQWIQ